jgi:hypothetical protein
LVGTRAIGLVRVLNLDKLDPATGLHEAHQGFDALLSTRADANNGEALVHQVKALEPVLRIRTSRVLCEQFDAVRWVLREALGGDITADELAGLRLTQLRNDLVEPVAW